MSNCLGMAEEEEGVNSALSAALRDQRLKANGGQVMTGRSREEGEGMENGCDGGDQRRNIWNIITEIGTCRGPWRRVQGAGKGTMLR